MAQSEGDASLSRQQRGFTVKASPFNGVKLDLAVIVVVAVVWWLIHSKLTENGLIQLGLLAGYGVLAMLWLMMRTHQISRRQAEQQAVADHHGQK